MKRKEKESGCIQRKDEKNIERANQEKEAHCSENGRRKKMKRRSTEVIRLPESDINFQHSSIPQCSYPQNRRKIFLVIGLSVPSFKQEILDQMFPKPNIEEDRIINQPNNLEKNLIFIWYNLHDDPCDINFKGKTDWDYVFKENVSDIDKILRIHPDRTAKETNDSFGFDFFFDDEILIIIGAGASCTTFESYKKNNFTSSSSSMGENEKRKTQQKMKNNTNYPFDKEFLLSTLACNEYFDSNNGECLCQENYEFLLSNTIELTAKLRYDELRFRSLLTLKEDEDLEGSRRTEKKNNLLFPQVRNESSDSITMDSKGAFLNESDCMSVPMTNEDDLFTQDSNNINALTRKEIMSKYYPFYKWLRHCRDLIYGIITFNIDSLEVHALCDELDEVELQKNTFFIADSKIKKSKSIKRPIFQLHGNLNTLTTLNLLQEESLYHNQRSTVPLRQIPSLWNNIFSLKNIYEGHYRWFQLLFPNHCTPQSFHRHSSSFVSNSPGRSTSPASSMPSSNEIKNFYFCFSPTNPVGNTSVEHGGRRASGRLVSKEAFLSDLLMDLMYNRKENSAPLSKIGTVENKAHVEKLNSMIRKQMGHLCIGNCLYNEDIGDGQMRFEIVELLESFLLCC